MLIRREPKPMHRRLQNLIGGEIYLLIAVFILSVAPIGGQAPSVRPTRTDAQFPPYKAARNAEGRADLSGIWQALVTADIDIQDHDAQAGPHSEVMGAYGAWPGGQGIVEGGEIPYRPEALAKKKANAEKR